MFWPGMRKVYPNLHNTASLYASVGGFKNTEFADD